MIIIQNYFGAQRAPFACPEPDGVFGYPDECIDVFYICVMNIPFEVVRSLTYVRGN
jgi:hypothetical protein